MKDKDFCLCEDGTFADWATAYCHFTKRTGNIVDITLTYWNDFLHFVSQTVGNCDNCGYCLWDDYNDDKHSLIGHICKLLIPHFMQTYQIMPINAYDNDVIKKAFSGDAKYFLLNHGIDCDMNGIYLFNLKGHIYIIGNIDEIDKNYYTITTLEGLVYTLSSYNSNHKKDKIINELYTVFKPYAKVIV